MRTNQKSQRCEACGVLVASGQGSLEYVSQDWLDDNDTFDREPGWEVYCLDTAGCDARVEENRKAAEIERAEQERKAAERAAWKAEFARLFPRDGGAYDRPEDGGCWHLDGTRIRIDGGFSIYGTGEEIVVSDDAIWVLRNNGMDGDDWSRNNVATGGAGAIGLRYDRTPERIAFLRAMPGGEAIDETPEDKRRSVLAHMKKIALVKSNADGRALFPDDPVDARHPNPAVWIDLHNLRIGMSLDGQRVYLRAPYPNTDAWRDRFYAAGFDISDNASRVYLHFENTPEREASIRALWPAWVGTSEPGRYHVGERHVTDNAADALRAAHIDRVAVNAADGREGIRVEPGHSLIHLDDKTAQWDDGKVDRFASLRLRFYSIRRMQRGTDEYYARRREQGENVPEEPCDDDAYYRNAGFPEPPALPDHDDRGMSEDASTLLLVAGRRGSDEIDNLENIDRITSRETILAEETGGTGGGESRKIEKLSVRYLDNREATLYLATLGWWCMGEDGDADSDDYLFATESAARAICSR